MTCRVIDPRRGSHDHSLAPHLRFSWTLGPQGAHDLVQGTDVAVLAGGKLQSVTGCLYKVPTAA